MSTADAQPSEEPPEGTASDERLYTPEPGESQLTLRAVVVGCLIGGIVSGMNIYFGLKTGWSLGGSLIAAILGYSFFSVLVRPKDPYSRLETNITQTAGSAAGSMTSAAGLLAAIPAMGMLGHEFAWWELMIWALAVAYLGVFFAVPLRRQMVLQEKLRFPTGTATAETIMAMYSAGGDAIRKSRALLSWAGIAAAFTLLVYIDDNTLGLGLGHPDIQFGFFGVMGAWGFSLLISPMMTGAGILIGPRVGTSLLLGAIASWGILGPLAQSAGWAPGPIMAYSDGPRGWLLWPGVAIMVSDALTSLALSWRTILNTFTRKSDAAAVSDTAEPIPNSWWMGGLAVASVATTTLAWFVFDIPPQFSVLAIILSSVLAMIAVRSTGETDINPIGGMGKVTQLVYGALAPGSIPTNLMAAAITGAGASQAGDMMQDLKTGHLLGASPRAQFKAQLVGIGAGVVFCVPIYKLFDNVHEIGDAEGKFPAPAAHAWKAMAELLSQGFDALPAMAPTFVVGGLIFGALLAVLNKSLPAAAKKWLPSGLAFGIAFIVPAYYAIAMFLGSMLLVLWQKKDKAHCAMLSFAVASGLVAGEGLMGIVTSLIDLVKGMM